MSAKSERITILCSPDFKSFLNKEAQRERVSVSELVRQRCEAVPASEDEKLLLELVSEVSSATQRAKKSLEKYLREAEAIMKELRPV